MWNTYICVANVDRGDQESYRWRQKQGNIISETETGKDSITDRDVKFSNSKSRQRRERERERETHTETDRHTGIQILGLQLSLL